MAEKPKKTRSSAGMRKPALLKAVEDVGGRFITSFNTRGRDPAHCDPAGGSAGSLFFSWKSCKQSKNTSRNTTSGSPRTFGKSCSHLGDTLISKEHLLEWM